MLRRLCLCLIWFVCQQYLLGKLWRNFCQFLEWGRPCDINSGSDFWDELDRNPGICFYFSAKLPAAYMYGVELTATRNTTVITTLSLLHWLWKAATLHCHH